MIFMRIGRRLPRQRPGEAEENEESRGETRGTRGQGLSSRLHSRKKAFGSNAAASHRMRGKFECKMEDGGWGRRRTYLWLTGWLPCAILCSSRVVAHSFLWGPREACDLALGVEGVSSGDAGTLGRNKESHSWRRKRHETLCSRGRSETTA